MRALLVALLVAAVVLGGAFALWRALSPDDVPASGAGLEGFGQAAAVGFEVKAATKKSEQTSQRVARWLRTVRVNGRTLELSGELAWVEEPIVRTSFSGRRTIANWREEGSLGGQPLVIEGSWAQVLATGQEGAGAEDTVTRTFTWGERKEEVAGQGRYTFDAAAGTGTYVERMTLLGKPLNTALRLEWQTSGQTLSVTWTRRSQWGKGDVLENTGSYAGPELPPAVFATPYEVLVLLASAGDR